MLTTQVKHRLLDYVFLSRPSCLLNVTLVYSIATIVGASYLLSLSVALTYLIFPAKHDIEMIYSNFFNKKQHNELPLEAVVIFRTGL